MSQNRLWRHHFDLSNFLFGTKNLTLIYYSSHQYVNFFKNFDNDVTNNDVIDFKVFFLYLHLKTSPYSKRGTLQLLDWLLDSKSSLTLDGRL